MRCPICGKSFCRETVECKTYWEKECSNMGVEYRPEISLVPIPTSSNAPDTGQKDDE